MEKAPLMDFIHPKHFDAIVQATNELAGYQHLNEEGELVPTFKVASLPLKMGYALDNVVLLMNGVGLKQGNKTLQKNASNFSVLYKSEWSVKLSSASLRTLAFANN